MLITEDVSSSDGNRKVHVLNVDQPNLLSDFQPPFTLHPFPPRGVMLPYTPTPTLQTPPHLDDVYCDSANKALCYN